jgi:hypothetical protein
MFIFTNDGVLIPESRLIKVRESKYKLISISILIDSRGKKIITIASVIVLSILLAIANLKNHINPIIKNTRSIPFPSSK